MILPERVFGRSAVTRIFSGRAMAADLRRHVLLQLLLELRRVFLACSSSLDLTMTNAAMAVPLIS